MHGSFQGAGRGEGRPASLRDVFPHLEGLFTEMIALEAIADLRNGCARQQGRHPEQLDDQMIDQLPDFPLGARRAAVPLVRVNRGNPATEVIQRPSMQHEKIAHDLNYLLSELKSTVEQPRRDWNRSRTT
jgi:hypothetical protein